ncbi:Abi family protein [Gardnerella vaginalis]|uniref:Abi-like protein n=1 Tax=Gardnerella vaginalis TaxID=2702 RepID=A0A133NSS1_GARVA|nr:Abi family protein [Gardnerella vaginalis]KXA19331.1 Abi-like protein [Gardnerella vaginalis]
MTLKPALTYDQQIARLVNDHHLKISNIEFAKGILTKVNYYRLSGYGVGLKNANNKEYYQDTVSIEQLFNLYCFDSQFKNNLMRTIEQIEIELRTQIVYYLSIKYGPEVLMSETNFVCKTNKQGQSIYSILIKSLNKEIERQKNKPFVKHHIEKYNSQFPIWVSVELMSFGSLSSLFSILKTEDQKNISRYYNTDPKYLKNWILCLVEVRNICAHYTRLYNMPLKENPRLYKENLQYKGKQNKIFPVLLITKRMLKANEQWCSLLKDLKNTFAKYESSFRFDFMGFPKNWEEIL